MSRQASSHATAPTHLCVANNWVLGSGLPSVLTHTVPRTLSWTFPSPPRGGPEAEPPGCELTLGRALGPDASWPHPQLRQPLQLPELNLGNTPTTGLVPSSPGKEAFSFSFYDQEEEPLGGQVMGPYTA